jgi:hypothetical protein
MFFILPVNAETTLKEGFSWAKSGPGETDFLIPENWFLKIEQHEGTYAIFITQEDLTKVKEFQTGFTVNVIGNISKKTGVKPSQYAQAFILDSLKGKEVVQKPWGLENDKIKGFGIQVKDKIKIMHYMLLANDSTNTLFITFFESPPAEWEDAWHIGNYILNNIRVDDEV